MQVLCTYLGSVSMPPNGWDHHDVYLLVLQYCANTSQKPVSGKLYPGTTWSLDCPPSASLPYRSGRKLLRRQVEAAICRWSGLRISFRAFLLLAEGRGALIVRLQDPCIAPSYTDHKCITVCAAMT
ncbi:hypothetical protein LIA77_01128 [Sarocladium implicatum]|nr:hypothetical protein LIA77_01128 [Sarocladium implicatum]